MSIGLILVIALLAGLNAADNRRNELKDKQQEQIIELKNKIDKLEKQNKVEETQSK